MIIADLVVNQKLRVTGLMSKLVKWLDHEIGTALFEFMLGSKCMPCLMTVCADYIIISFGIIEPCKLHCYICRGLIKPSLSDFHSFVCSLFPKADLKIFIITVNKKWT